MYTQLPNILCLTNANSIEQLHMYRNSSRGKVMTITTRYVQQLKLNRENMFLCKKYYSDEVIKQIISSKLQTPEDPNILLHM